MKNLFFAICMALFCFSSVKAQEIVSTSPGSYGKIIYVIAVPAAKYSAPYASAGFGPKPSGWVTYPVETSGNTYLISMETYNTAVAMYYCSEVKKENRAMPSSLPFLNSEKTLLTFYLKDGKMEEYSYTPTLPGSGDHVLRSEWVGGKLRMYCNLVLLSEKASSFVMLTSCNEWERDSIIITDASGWGYMDLDVAKNTNENKNSIRLGYGGTENGKEVWPNILGSDYIHLNKDGVIDGLEYPIPSKP